MAATITITRSFLRLYTQEYLEFFRAGYKGYKNSIMYINGDYIPSWFGEETGVASVDSVILQELDKRDLYNEDITVINSNTLTPSYSADVNGNYFYADKQAQTLEDEKIYRLFIETDTEQYWSELFKKIR